MCLLPRPHLGPGAAGLQVHPVQASGAQEVPQARAEALLQRARRPHRGQGGRQWREHAGQSVLC